MSYSPVYPTAQWLGYFLAICETHIQSPTLHQQAKAGINPGSPTYWTKGYKKATSPLAISANKTEVKLINWLHLFGKFMSNLQLVSNRPKLHFLANKVFI